MAKKTDTGNGDIFNSSKYDNQHLRNLNSYQKRVEDAINKAVDQATRLGTSVQDQLNLDDQPFTFDSQNLRIQQQAISIFSALEQNITATITDGITREWSLSETKNDTMAKDWLIQNGSTAGALEAFIARTENGMNLSQRVWKYVGQIKTEIELSLSIGLRQGMSAANLSRQVRQYLRQPDKLFRRVRNKYGQLVLSQRAAAYHPGRGVYRSSYQNAMRLTRTETNIAYRTADHNRWQALDFVVGIEIHLSNNHNCKGVAKGEFRDVCDELAGRYPKTFQFSGWHPNCRCSATSILKTQKEMAEDERRMLQGLPPLPPESSVNFVRNVPPAFTNWVEENREKISSAINLPYFVKDNQGLVFNIMAEANQV